jgi:hypothetical protein
VRNATESLIERSESWCIFPLNPNIPTQ